MHVRFLGAITVMPAPDRIAQHIEEARLRRRRAGLYGVHKEGRQAELVLSMIVRIALTCLWDERGRAQNVDLQTDRFVN